VLSGIRILQAFISFRFVRLKHHFSYQLFIQSCIAFLKMDCGLRRRHVSSGPLALVAVSLLCLIALSNAGLWSCLRASIEESDVC
jgi:hypothetical protein